MPAEAAVHAVDAVRRVAAARLQPLDRRCHSCTIKGYAPIRLVEQALRPAE